MTHQVTRTNLSAHKFMSTGQSAIDSASLGYKLIPPLPSAFQVWRSDVNTYLEAAAENVKLVLIRAPAGFGKTALMLQHRSRLMAKGEPSVWLTLDSADNDMTRFLSFLSDCLSNSNGANGAALSTPRKLADGDTYMERSLALHVMDAVARLTSPFTLFLDEFESIQNIGVTQFTRQIIEQLPPGTRIIIASRNLPDLGLARLRARGQLLEIEPEQLRFSLKEVEDFMTARLGTLLKAKDISRLHQSTEGWGAALWLASLALERQQNPDAYIDTFSGSNKAIANYLAEDVIAHLPAGQREFLLRTSILKQLSAPLCDVVTNRSDSQQILEHLDTRGLFLIPLNEERTLYRYHTLFADFLRVQLRAAFPEEIPCLHRTAADWFQAERRPVPAIDHAIASGDSGFAAGLLVKHVDSFLTQGRARLLSRWLDSFPGETLAQYPRLRVTQAWVLTFTHRHDEAMALLDSLDAGDTLDDTDRAQVLAMRPTLLGMMDRVADAYITGQENLHKVKAQNTFAYSLLANSMANLMMATGKYADARRLLDRARQSHVEINSTFSMIMAECVDGKIDLLKGNLRQATARFKFAFNNMGRDTSPDASGNGLAGIQLAETLYEADECEQAERLLNVCVPMARDIALPDQMISGYVLLSRIAYNRKDVSMALQYLNDLEHLGHRQHLPRLAASAKLERARIALFRGDLELAREELQRARAENFWLEFAGVSPPANDVDTLASSTFRLMLHSGEAKEALPQIKFELQQAKSQQRHHRALKLKILLAEALRRLNQPIPALRSMREALLFASNEGFARIFLDEGATVLKIIRDVRATEPTPAAGAKNPFIEYLDRLIDSMGEGEEAPEPDASAQALTYKETRVLELLAEGLSNHSIGERLFVSETTVRTHLRNIYNKLGAHNRTQAIAISRGRKLIR